MPKTKCGYSHILDPDYKCSKGVLANSEHGFCIFHEPGKEKDSELFDEGIKQKLKDKIYIFTGYVFPGDTDYFDGHKFAKTACFDRATFLGDRASFAEADFSGEQTSFSYAKFSGEQTYFSGATFIGEQTDFSYATFSGERTDFFGALFSGELTDFYGATFSGELTSFIRATFSGQLTIFSGAKFTGERIDFSEAEFMGQAVIFKEVDLSRVGFRDFKLLNRMDLVDIEAWAKKKYSGFRTRNTCCDEITAPDADDPNEAFRAASRTLGALESVAKANHNAALASDFAYGRKECERRADPRWYVRWFKRLVYAGIFGWGEKLSNLAVSSALLVFFLAFVFMFSGIHIKSDDPDNPERLINRERSMPRIEEALPTLKDFGNCLYFSIVTFTTLGYGDMRPAGPFSKGLASAEAFSGAFIIATFAALYLRRLLT